MSFYDSLSIETKLAVYEWLDGAIGCDDDLCNRFEEALKKQNYFGFNSQDKMPAAPEDLIPELKEFRAVIDVFGFTEEEIPDSQIQLGIDILKDYDEGAGDIMLEPTSNGIEAYRVSTGEVYQ